MIKIAGDGDRYKFTQFVANSPLGDPRESYEWHKVDLMLGFNETIPVYVEREDKIVAAAVIRAKQIPLMRREILHIRRGPVLDVRDYELLKEFTDYLKDFARKRKAMAIRISPAVVDEDVESERNIRSLGFAYSNDLPLYYTLPKSSMHLDLDKSCDELMASFSKRCRYNIRLAQKKGVTVSISTDKSDLAAIYPIYLETCKRDGFPPASLAFLEASWDADTPALQTRLFLAHYEGELLAGAIVLLFGNKAWYYIGASSNNNREVCPNHLIQWTVIQWAKANGCSYYDFLGVASKDGTDSWLEGVNRFKRGFSPRHVQYIGTYHLIVSPVAFQVYLVFLRVKRVLQTIKRKLAR